MITFETVVVFAILICAVIGLCIYKLLPLIKETVSKNIKLTFHSATDTLTEDTSDNGGIPVVNLDPIATKEESDSVLASIQKAHLLKEKRQIIADKLDLLSKDVDFADKLFLLFKRNYQISKHDTDCNGLLKLSCLDSVSSYERDGDNCTIVNITLWKEHESHISLRLSFSADSVIITPYHRIELIESIYDIADRVLSSVYILDKLEQQTGNAVGYYSDITVPFYYKVFRVRYDELSVNFKDMSGLIITEYFDTNVISSIIMETQRNGNIQLLVPAYLYDQSKRSGWDNAKEFIAQRNWLWLQMSIELSNILLNRYPNDIRLLNDIKESARCLYKFQKDFNDKWVKSE